MKILVIAVLVVAAAGWPIPDHSNGKPWGDWDNGEADSAGHHQHSGHYVHQAATVSVQPTPEVQQATAAFMSAWNEAAARATKIQSTLVKSGSPGGHYVVEVPRQVEATNEVQRATSEFMAAWNQAARRAYTVEHAVNAAPQPVQETADVKRATAEFMSAWEAAARQASAIKQAVSYTGTHQQVDHTDEVKKATADFMAAWNEAASRVPHIKSTMYTISGTVASPAPLHTTESGPQFTPSVEQATAEFMKAWHAAAAAAKAAQDTDVIARSGLHSSRYTSEGLAASGHSSASASSLQYQAGVPQPVRPTPEVESATAAFMAAWNEAAARARVIESTLVKSSWGGQYTVEVPRQVQETEEVKRATAQFMAAWNEAASRSSTVKQALHGRKESLGDTYDVERETSEFVSAWGAAAERASDIRREISYTKAPEPVDHTDAVKKATAEFMAAWKEAADRVPRIKSTMYSISGAVAAPDSHHVRESATVFSPSVEQATAEFMKAWHAAAKAAADAPDTDVTSDYSYSDKSSSYRASEVSAHHTGIPQPVRPTPEVESATAAFMAAWNEAAARAKVIESTLVRSSWGGQYTVEVPRQVQETEEVKRATAQFMAAWNEAASRSSTVKQALHGRKESLGGTYDVERETSEFVSAWGAAAERASDIRREISYTQAPEPVDHTDAVKKATAEFMAAWKEAADRVPRIKSTMYSISGAVAAPDSHHVRESATVFSPSVEQATAEFMKAWHAAAKAAADAPDTDVTSDYSYSDKSSSYRASEDSALEDGVPKPVRPTPEVERATAIFMAAWNKAADRAAVIESTLARKSSADREEVEFAKEDAEAEEVKKATDEFAEAWNEASQHESTIKQALHSAPEPVKETEDVERATSEFMSAWKTAAQQASGIGRFVSPSGAPQPVEHTAEVKLATQQFLSAWKEAAKRVPKIESSIYRISGTKASPATHHAAAVSVPQFTPSVAEATAEFTKAWNAAAARTSHRSKEISSKPFGQDTSSAYQSSSKVTAALETVQPTPEVQSATASFMAAWNAAAERANKIQSLLVKSSHLGQKVEIPQQAQDTDAVKTATEEFMASWNAAAQSGAAVEQAFSTLPQQTQQTAEVQKATAEFMAAWHAAAEQASAIKQSIPASSGTFTAQKEVATAQDVEKATANFMTAWNQAAAKVPKIETTMYTLSGSDCRCEGAPAAVVDTPEVLAAREAFMVKFREAQNAASRTPVSQGVLPLPQGTAAAPSVHAVVFNPGAPAQVYTFDGRIFSPVAGQPKDVKEVRN
ncbi:uncharacterized protein [Macrobrachium rosenbergii]|uniref:uncharacterized protein n=1 Tax=Macrobrachium rosenbergii TaxID=79674 RepID=UPI0034D39937